MQRIDNSPAPVRATRQAPPLTHHDILLVVAPFAAHDRHVDLEATDRQARELVFKPVIHNPESNHPIEEHLRLKQLSSRRYRLTRTLTADGLSADISIEGEDIARLLDEIERVEPGTQFKHHDDWTLALSYDLEPITKARNPDNTTEYRRVFRYARAFLGDFSLEVNGSRGRGLSTELKLTSRTRRPLKIPDDFLAVIDWGWGPLRRTRGEWQGTLRLARREPKRTLDAEDKLERTLAHLAEISAMSPTRFHDEYGRARWRVALQRVTPLLVLVGMVALSPLVFLVDLDKHAFMRMFVFHLPPLLMVVLFARHELPLVEIPPLPRPLTIPAWIEGGEDS